MSATPTTSAQTSSVATIVLTLLVVLLGAIPVLLAAAVLLPQFFGSTLGVQSPVMAWVFGAVVALGVFSTPMLTTMGRVGAIMLAVGAGGLAIGRTFFVQPGMGPAFNSGWADAGLMILIPAGYFILLFGVLRAMGWSRIGSRVIAVAATALTVVIFIVPSPPLADIDMGHRLVTHGLFIVGAIVAIIAVVIELVRHRGVQSGTGAAQ